MADGMFTIPRDGDCDEVLNYIHQRSERFPYNNARGNWDNPDANYRIDGELLKDFFDDRGIRDQDIEKLLEPFRNTLFHNDEVYQLFVELHNLTLSPSELTSEQLTSLIWDIDWVHLVEKIGLVYTSFLKLVYKYRSYHLIDSIQLWVSASSTNDVTIDECEFQKIVNLGLSIMRAPEEIYGDIQMALKLGHEALNEQ